MIKFLLLLAVVLLVTPSQALSLDKGNHEAVSAFNAGLLDLWTNGTYNSIYLDNFGKLPARFSDCTEDPLALSWPVSLHPDGLLQHILDTQEISLAFFPPISVPPGFELDTQTQLPNGGFYPELAEAILDRIARHYDVESISIDWVPIPAVTDFYPRHYAGDWDAIWLNLFKNALWSSPVAPRNELWDFTCGLLTTEPLRYYICPSPQLVDADPVTSPADIDGVNTRVGVIIGGAQDAAARRAFPNSVIVDIGTISSMVQQCQAGTVDAVVELPNRIGDLLENVKLADGPLGTSVNTGGAFRYDAPEDCEDSSETEQEPRTTTTTTEEDEESTRKTKKTKKSKKSKSSSSSSSEE